MVTPERLGYLNLLYPYAMLNSDRPSRFKKKRDHKQLQKKGIGESRDSDQFLWVIESPLNPPILGDFEIKLS